MKVDFRFHCFGCGADGDVIDLTAKLFQLSLRQAAEKLATDFGLSATDNFQPLPCKPVEKPLSPKEQFYKILCGYRSLLANWRMAYAPKNPEASLHPCFVASLHYADRVQYLLDILLQEGPNEKQQLLNGKEVTALGKAIARKPKMQHSAPARNWVGDNGKIIEPLFADYFLSLHPMRCFQGRLFTVDGMVEDEAPLKKEIYEQIRYYATTSVARRIEHIMQAIKLACASEPPEIQTDRIHVRNGTYFVDGHFTPEKEYCMNRLPIAYVPEAPAPTRWLQFLNELLYEEDIPALQEYIGYCLLPVTKAQKMLLMVGKGGEGKSRIGLILRELFGNSMYTGSLQKVETNRFARADLEYKLLLVDDDMKTEALPQTNNIKTLVTLEDKIDIERKGQQSVQGTLYVRFACFGNGSLHALYDKSNGFYRRQLLLTTKEKPVGRVDDPFLIDKMRNEKEGILLWALEGLHRLIRNNYQFTISERTAANLKEAMEQGNNILGFLKSEGYFEIRQGAKCKSTDFYKVYERWCLDNLEKPLAASTFIHHLKDNQKSLGIVYDDKCIGTNRGFHNVDVDLFLPVDVPSPWD